MRWKRGHAVQQCCDHMMCILTTRVPGCPILQFSINTLEATTDELQNTFGVGLIIEVNVFVMT